MLGPLMTATTGDAAVGGRHHNIAARCDLGEKLPTVDQPIYDCMESY